jgi:FkbM family methyltransferase
MPVGYLMKWLASRLPATWQSELKRVQCRHQIKKGQFLTDEKEFGLLREWVTAGDWVLDVGANIGHYTCRLSEIVGPKGRVIAFEPVPETFELLAANMLRFPLRNVSLLNFAASESAISLGMNVPRFETGLYNYYMAHLTADDSDRQVLCVMIDGLNLPHRIQFVKIDAEGHELSVLRGMRGLLKRDRPVLVVEDNSSEVLAYLTDFGYASRTIESSSNRIFEPDRGRRRS